MCMGSLLSSVKQKDCGCVKPQEFLRQLWLHQGQKKLCLRLSVVDALSEPSDAFSPREEEDGHVPLVAPESL